MDAVNTMSYEQFMACALPNVLLAKLPPQKIELAPVVLYSPMQAIVIVAAAMELETNVAMNLTVSPEVEEALVVICVLPIEAASDLLNSPGSEEPLDARAD